MIAPDCPVAVHIGGFSVVVLHSVHAVSRRVLVTDENEVPIACENSEFLIRIVVAFLTTLFTSLADTNIQMESGIN